MRRCLESIVLVVTLTAVLGCGTSPTAPGPTLRPQPGPPAFDPTALLAGLSGPYTLTFEADDAGCPLPPSLKVITYDVWLRPAPRFRYLGVDVPSKQFVGDLWALTREEDGFTLRWNVECEVPDIVGSISFYLCGEGRAFATDEATISGVLGTPNVYLDIDRRPFCTIGAHRFVFQRRN